MLTPVVAEVSFQREAIDIYADFFVKNRCSQAV